MNELVKCAVICQNLFSFAWNEWQANYYNPEYYMTAGQATDAAYGQLDWPWTDEDMRDELLNRYPM
jgi:hypothetical protein